MPQCVFCGTNLLSLDELQVHGEGDGNTGMLGYTDKYSDNDDSEVVREDNSDHSVGGYSARCSKSGKSDCIFQVLKQSKFSAGLNQDQQWVILGQCTHCHYCHPNQLQPSQTIVFAFVLIA